MYHYLLYLISTKIFFRYLHGPFAYTVPYKVISTKMLGIC